MKTKPTLLIILLFAFTAANSFSQIPNNGFENWTNSGNYMNPDFWMTTNSTSTSSFYPVTRDASHYPASVGSYSIRMENKPSLLPGTEALGIAISGSSFNMGPDFPITGHPNSLTGYYKYAPLNGDTMHILIVLFNNTTLVASGIFETTIAAPNWTSFNIPISNYTTATSAKIYMGAYNISDAPPQFVPYGNSVLNIDNLNFDTLIVAGISDHDKTSEFFAYPNPSNGQFTIALNGNYSSGIIKISNILGEEISAKSFANATTLNVEIEQESGLYFLIIENEKGESTVLKIMKE